MFVLAIGYLVGNRELATLDSLSQAHITLLLETSCLKVIHSFGFLRRNKGNRVGYVIVDIKTSRTVIDNMTCTYVVFLGEV